MMRKIFALILAAIICAGCGEVKEVQADVMPPPDPIEEKLQILTLEEKIGQMVMIGVYGTELNDDIIYSLNQFHFGGVIFYDRNLESVAQTKKFLPRATRPPSSSSAKNNGAFWLATDSMSAANFFACATLSKFL